MNKHSFISQDSEDRGGFQYSVRLQHVSGSRRIAPVFRNGERIAEASYSTNWFADGMACAFSVVAFFLPLVVMFAFLSKLPDLIQRILNPIHPEAVPGWVWCGAMIILAGLAYLLSLVVLVWTRSRVRIQVRATNGDEAVMIEIVERRSSLPWRVKASITISGQDAGRLDGHGRSLLTFRGQDPDPIQIASLKEHEGDRQTLFSSLFVLIGMLLNAVAVPTRRRTHQQWSVEQSGSSLGWIQYRRSLPEEYLVFFNQGAADYTLVILSIALFLAKSASSGNLESHEEMHAYS